MDMSTIMLPFTAVIDFMRTPLNIGGYTFSIFELDIALLTMTVVIRAIFNFFDS